MLTIYISYAIISLSTLSPTRKAVNTVEESRFNTDEPGRDVMRELFIAESSLFRVTLRVFIPYKDEGVYGSLTLLVERLPGATAAFRHPNGDLVFETRGRFSEDGSPFHISLSFNLGDTDPGGAEVKLSPESITEARRLLEH